MIEEVPNAERVRHRVIKPRHRRARSQKGDRASRDAATVSPVRPLEALPFLFREVDDVGRRKRGAIEAHTLTRSLVFAHRTANVPHETLSRVRVERALTTQHAAEQARHCAAPRELEPVEASRIVPDQLLRLPLAK